MIEPKLTTGKGIRFRLFNNNYKITAPVFKRWMSLLKAVEGSVLWLLRDNPEAEANLIKEAVKDGIDSRRLIFTERLPFDEYLARHCLADLFLDTLPYNAHSTGSHALWAGLPVLTCLGNSFAGRVGASMLNAVGLHELVTNGLDEYEGLALKLATDAPLLQSIRRKLAQNRVTFPLFNADRFRRHLESAYLQMWELYRLGDKPKGFSISSS
jgi:predicted O-linked N-acetylglucosamine transferase (SPINDLY family)